MPYKTPYPSRSLRVRASFYALIILAAVVSLPPAFTRLTVLAQGDEGIIASADSGDVQPSAEFIRQLSLPANDVIYNPADQMLYASVPSSAGAAGNSIVPINPVTGATGTPVFIGSEPTKLAMSDDGRTLYVSLEGAYAIRRFDTATRTPGQQFPLGGHSFFGTYLANDLAVAPGNPNVVAVARHYPGTSPPEAGVAVFDNGVQRPKTGPDHSVGADFLAFSATESKLYGGGYSSGLRTMTIDATGVAATTYTTFSVGNRIKFANGLVYSSAGQVVNPDTSTLLGTFSGVSTNAFVIDTTAGRAYYFTRENFGSGALTLKAFDLNTFVPAGSATLSGINDEPTTLTRWGANGLAFRTNTGKLYLIKTSLIPSSEPDPTPTPTPAPTTTPTPAPVPTFIRQIPLLANDLIYSPQSQQLYASVPSAAGAKGNSVTRLNPETGEVGPSLFVGSEPTRLALADDGQTMYVGLSGAGAVRKLDVSAQTAGIQFNLGSSTFDGVSLPDDIAVMPGSPGTVAVSKSSGGVTLYDEGVPRTRSDSSGGPVEFASPTRLYTGSSFVQKLAVAANGLTNLGSFGTSSSGPQTQFVNGLLYLSGGVVVDPEAGVIKGRFSGLEYNNLMAIDAAKNRAFFLTNNFGSGWTLRSYELDTFLPVASVPMPGISSFSGFGTGPSSLVRWGKNGLAFRSNDRVFLIQTALVDSSDPIPAATPTPSPTPSPTPVYIPTVVKQVNLPANDLVINTVTQTLYASVPSNAGGGAGNTITTVDPKTGAVGTSTFIGSEPNKLAISDDGQVLYVNLEGAQAVRRFDTATKTPGLQFSVGATIPADMEVMPGNPQTLAVSRGLSGFSTGSVAIYDNGVQRPNASSGGAYAILPIEFGASASVLYGYDSYSSGFELVKFDVNASGVTRVSLTYNLLSGYDSVFEFAGGRLYSGIGRIVDPETKTLVGKFNSGGSALLVDQKLGRAFFLSSGFGSSVVLSAYDINTFLPLGSVTLPNVTGTPTGLVRWGANGLAFCTRTNSSNPSGATGQIYLVRSALVSDAEPIESTVQFSAANYNTFESTGNNSVVITVTRTGGVAGAGTINYATGGGTATPGSDYTATSGTLSFAAGETSKTFTVAITDDNLYEANISETIGLTLSSPTGDATLGSQATATVTIQDNDFRPSIIPVNLTVSEGQSGTTTTAQFVVRLSNPSVETISVNYATADSTAKADSDYVATSGTLTFQPGEVEKSFPVQIKGDAVDEGSEQFLISFSNPVNVNLYSGNGFVTIPGNQRALIQFGSSGFAVGEMGVRATITVTRTVNLTGVVTVNYATGGGTATPGTDYTATSGTLTFAAGETSKTFTIPITDDNLYEPGVDETIGLSLSGLTGNATSGSPMTATLVIQDNDSRPSIVPVNLTVSEGQSGTTAQFVVRLSNPSVETISVNYGTVSGTAMADSDYVPTSGALVFQPGEVEKSFPIQIKGDAVDEGTEQFLISFSNSVNANLPSGNGIVTITADEVALIQFSAAEFTVGEGEARATVTVTRTGPLTQSATVDYLTLDNPADIPCDPNITKPDGTFYPQGAAFARCDYATTLDTLRFAPGESQKTFTIPLVDDSHVEPQEFAALRLVAPAGAALGTRSDAVLSIRDNDAADQPNPIDAHDFFVRMQYLDFLSREADADGLAAWTKVLGGCPNAFNREEKNTSAECDRNLVSSSFFRSLEFQLKGYFVYRFYRVAFNRRPSYVEFVTDMRRVTGQTAEEVYSKRRAFGDAWVLRPEFQNIHGAQTSAGFVDSLLTPYGLTAINTPDPANFDGDALVRLTRDELVAALDAQRMTRAQVLRAVVQSREVDGAEYNGAFVAMQYYGYMRRAPEQSGYEAWLRVITRGDGFRVMVDGFMNSTEYRLRFGK
ncbi:MAG TPA: Calx-beta domain-containing protein [Pyrinomonadaceae bacterium]|nr:Calx-beta domain-containing protein [Pyrinomonadaceae bacterium]